MILMVTVFLLFNYIRAFFFVFGKQRYFYNIVTFFEIERTADFGFYFIRIYFICVGISFENIMLNFCLYQYAMIFSAVCRRLSAIAA